MAGADVAQSGGRLAPGLGRFGLGGAMVGRRDRPVAEEEGPLGGVHQLPVWALDEELQPFVRVRDRLDPILI